MFLNSPRQKICPQFYISIEFCFLFSPNILSTVLVIHFFLNFPHQVLLSTALVIRSCFLNFPGRGKEEEKEEEKKRKRNRKRTRKRKRKRTRQRKRKRKRKIRKNTEKETEKKRGKARVREKEKGKRKRKGTRGKERGKETTYLSGEVMALRCAAQ